MAYRVGIDIGGTFTDAILVDEASGAIQIGKVPSTPEDPSQGFMAVTEQLLQRHTVDPTAITYVVHGTTVATNAIIEGKVARTGFVTTEGFRDMLELARQIRPSLYDLQFEKPRPLVPRHLCCGVPERLDAQGEVLQPLDETAVRQVAQALHRAEVEAVAVCLLHSYVNPVHEVRVGEILRQLCPQAVISLSSEVAPEIREYYRASTTVINAAIRPVVARYLERIAARLGQAGLTAELLLMQSSGGVYTFAEASRRPVFMVESGPAAGVISAAHLGERLGVRDLISFDMGGTTAKVGLIQDGTPRVTKEYEVGAAARVGVGGQRGAGYPMRTPVIDLVEIGAGGGSIAWVDPGGSLRVGPRSAGANPGPACYGQGGQEPTVTDANLLLGRLQPDYFLGGRMALDREAARQAIRSRCAEPLRLSEVEAAHGIVEIANAAMVNALRLVSVQRGYDPREFVLVAFGGAGPLHANSLAVQADIPTVVVPPSPGTFSALGLLVTDLKHDFAITWIRRVDEIALGELEALFAELRRQGEQALAREGVGAAAAAYVRQVEMRYVGQSYELTLPLPDGPLQPADLETLVRHFYQAHERAYGFSAADEPVEFVHLRLTAVGQIVKPRPQEPALQGEEPAVARLAARPVFFAERGGYVESPLYDRYRLGPGMRIPGPAVVVEMDATTVIHPDYVAAVDRYGNLVVIAVAGGSA